MVTPFERLERHVNSGPDVSSLLVEACAQGTIQHHTVGGLRDYLMGSEIYRGEVDEIWSRIVALTKKDPDEWIPIAIILARPGLAKAASRAWRECRDMDYEELEAHVISSASHTLTTMVESEVDVCSKMCKEAQESARIYARREQRQSRISREFMRESSQPRLPFGHVDLILADAIASGIVSAHEVGMFTRVRLEKESLTFVARESEYSRTELLNLVKRAEHRIIQWLGTGKPKPGLAALEQAG